MKHLNQYINIRKGNSRIIATNETIRKIVKEEIMRLGEGADLNHIDVSQCTDLSLSAFDDASFGLFNDYNSKKRFTGDISKWNVSHVEDMRFMFYCCKDFNCDLSEWDVHKCRTGMYMFYKCENFNCDLSGWNLNDLGDFNHMFDGCHPMLKNKALMPEIVREEYERL